MDSAVAEVAGAEAPAAVADASAGRHPKSGKNPKVPHPPYPTSICHRCEAHRYVKARKTLFVMCRALSEKYPPQPVLQCKAFRPEP